MVEDLTARSFCGKNKDAASQLKQKGNQCLLSGDCANALASYSQVRLYCFLCSEISLSLSIICNYELQTRIANE